MAMALFISPALTATALALIILVSLSLQVHIRMAGRIGQSLVDSNFALQENTVENLSGVRVTKSFMLEKPRLLQFDKIANELGDNLYKVNRNFSQITVIQEALLFGLVAGIVYVGVKILSLDMVVIVTLLFVLYRLNPRITTLNSIRQQLASKMPSFAAINATINETRITNVTSGAVPFNGLKDKIELRSVSFSYDGESEVVSDANFTIEQGQVTAFAGPSGAGKSTVVDLIQRFYDPVKGAILVDGQDLRDLVLADWRNTIGIVSQDMFLFNDTVAANIGMYREGTTDQAVKDAACQSFAHDFIQALPQGYDTLVGDRGLNLSGGQRQRIALARAILKKPTILILDEATSSLDSESEQLVRQYIHGIRGEVTVLVVAHRMATIQDADKIIVLEDGKVMQDGDWEGLIAEEGTLSQYHRLQSGG
jgi:subfamily B ATP-binding cassette protein MsbA